jgi:hypothetical protein
MVKPNQLRLVNGEPLLPKQNEALLPGSRLAQPHGQRLRRPVSESICGVAGRNGTVMVHQGIVFVHIDWGMMEGVGTVPVDVADESLQ